MLDSLRAGPAAGRAGDQVTVDDRRGVRLPYSKGLMAVSIMATGESPDRAYSLASIIENQLLETGRRWITAEELSSLATAVLARWAGPLTASRYEAWRVARRHTRPIVVLIGGTAGVGKSTLATTLAHRLGITRVITTDAVRELMRDLITAADAPELHRSSFEAGAISADHPLEGFERQVREVASGTIGLLKRVVAEGDDVIVEGVHLVPGFLRADVERIREAAVVVQVVLTIEDTDVHTSHFRERRGRGRATHPDRYLRNLHTIRAIQDHIVRAAKRYGVTRIEVSNIDFAIQRVVEAVVARIMPALQYEPAG